MLLRAYREFEARVGIVRGGRAAKTKQVRLAVLAEARPFAISDIGTECAGVSRDMVRHVLRQMKMEGLIAPTVRSRGAKWLVLNKAAGESS